ncbi:MAG TPA: hypothetical protein VHS96_14555, partial [Bacteroidia bacterium]|nr:hypothetical protein [Bacteroidia bacterium]
MKRIFQSIAVLCFAGIVLAGCQSENVAPQEGSSGKVSLAGAAGDPHPALDTICQSSDTLFLYREDNGSPVVDKCFGVGGVLVPCTATNPMRWGGLVVSEGYINNENVIDCNFWMAAGWYCDGNAWDVAPTNGFDFDQNGVPTITNDWTNILVNPVQNKWQLRMAAADVPEGSFDLAVRVSAVRLNLFGAVTPGSETVLWGRNSLWNEPLGKAASNSQWIMHFTPSHCLENQTPAPDTTSICEVVYTGLSCTGNNLNSTVLHPVATESGVVSFAWDNGATTQDLTVSPTESASYAVTIKVDGVPTHVVVFNVNVIDVSCTITTGGGGYGGNGNSGNHNHGCNASHSGGNSNCNHRGHGRNCSGSHAANRSCNGGHTRGCSGNHSNNQTCQTGGGHRNNCSGQHNGGSCATGLQHAQGCNGNHHSYRGCNTNSNNGG